MFHFFAIFMYWIKIAASLVLLPRYVYVFLLGTVTAIQWNVISSMYSNINNYMYLTDLTVISVMNIYA